MASGSRRGTSATSSGSCCSSALSRYCRLKSAQADAKHATAGAHARRRHLSYTLYDHPAPSQHVVLIHSLAMDRSFWRPVAERLARNASVLIHDCRGHGRSDKTHGPVTVELHADDLADLL